MSDNDDDDDDDESYCDCADDLERHHRIQKAADGQFSETSGWAAIFGTASDPPTSKKEEDDKRCSTSCGPTVEEPSRCGRGGYRAVDNDVSAAVEYARRGALVAVEGGGVGGEGVGGPGQAGFGAGQGGFGAGQGGFGPGQAGYGAGQAGYGAGQGGYGAGQGPYGSGQGGYGPGKGGHGAGQGRYGAGQGRHGTGQGLDSEQDEYGGVLGAGPRSRGAGRGIHRVGPDGLEIGGKGGTAGVAGDSVIGGVVGGAKRRTAADIWIPLIGGGLVFLTLVGSLYRYFEVGPTVKSKVQTITTQIMNMLCEPKASVVSGIGAGIGGAGAGRGAGSGAGRAGGAGAGGSKACESSFSTESQTPRKKDPCGKKRIDNSRRKYPLPPSPFRFPAIPGLHDCTDDEENEEGVYVAPGPFEE